MASLPALLFLVTLFGILMEPLQNAVSRRYERQCDRYALQRTGSREALIGIATPVQSEYEAQLMRDNHLARRGARVLR